MFQPRSPLRSIPNRESFPHAMLIANWMDWGIIISSFVRGVRGRTNHAADWLYVPARKYHVMTCSGSLPEQVFLFLDPVRHTPSNDSMEVIVKRVAPWSFLLLFALLVACSSAPTPVPTTVPTNVPALPSATTLPATAAIPTAPATASAPTAPATASVPTMPATPSAPKPPTAQPAKFSGQALTTERNNLFAGSGLCAVCHTGMTDSAGANVSIDAAWRVTMMANAARDPYFQASVRGEIISNPSLQAVIEDTCSQCHTPMARYTVGATGDKSKLFGDGFLNPSNPQHAMALDGVSCTVCHQIRSERLGQPTSFDAGFAIDTSTPAGNRLVYGPFSVTDAQAALMKASSGFPPAQGPQIKQAELCATCHTLYTPYVDATGKVVGQFPEQMAYLEWQNSAYAGKQVCQDCHMPLAQGGVKLSVTGGDPRSPFFQHTFAGGNTYMVSILQAFGADLGVAASSDQLGAKLASMTDYDKTHVATLALDQTTLNGTKLSTNVIVKNLAGHKFPTGFPSRRAWLHVTVRDVDGRVIFESGAVKPDGLIVGNINDTDPAKFEPYFSEITSPDQVQIYEAIMGDTDGKVTTTLLRGAAYLKDDRLLPQGFDKAAAVKDIQVIGDAEKAKDFVGGGDAVHYVVDLSTAKGPFKLTAELLYQSIAYRWAQNLKQYNSAETARFLGYYAGVPNIPETLATAQVEVK